MISRKREISAQAPEKGERKKDPYIPAERGRGGDE